MRRTKKLKVLSSKTNSFLDLAFDVAYKAVYILLLPELFNFVKIINISLKNDAKVTLKAMSHAMSKATSKALSKAMLKTTSFLISKFDVIFDLVLEVAYDVAFNVAFYFISNVIYSID